METPDKDDMSNSGRSGETGAATGEWSKPQGVHIPEPTYMPVVVALGVVCMLWGIVTTYLMTLVGVVLFVVGTFGWIGELRHEHRHPGAQ
jgi:hypothetical protein